ncbi:hypothetical protein HNP37_004271 [Flavobacterium nitrogenifigens]|uniref:Uncharacterized protein n=2 Tax=Flavobacterium TaxID=237 RepID=A0A7W7N8Q2_9FLAO|nr:MULTISPECIES: hypothetical protein [Flavobacterium]MBB4804185.1 hypothetical protein [Flavobacterium nitrogenifigens]MBB6389144.1 hypothetical protein [Flavobacterium notoginsengisoli]
MLRVYLDWNAFSRLDDRDEIYKKASASLIDDSKFIIPFSHAHLLDLHRGYLKVGMDGIAGKLDILQKYSKGLLITDTNEDQLEFVSIDSKKAMEIHIENFDRHKELNISIEELLEPLELLKPLLDIQIPNPLAKPSEDLDDTEYKKLISSTPRTAEAVKKLIGTSETTSMAGLIENLIKMASTIHKDDSYSEFRDAYQKDLKTNTGRMRDKRFDPLESLDENAKKMKMENFIALHENFLSKNDNISLFKKIQELCRHLDFNGFFSDVIKPGHHLDNIETDYQHIGYASTCDIFISADNNTREKAKLAYKLLNIDIKVFTPKEFVEFLENNGSKIKDGNEFLDYLFWLRDNEPSVVTNEFGYHYVPSYILEYFNLVAIPTNDQEHFILHKYGSPNRISNFINEVTSVRDQLSELFGTPEIEANKVGDHFYGASWTAYEEIVVILEYAEKNLILQVRRGQKLPSVQERIETQ